MDDRTFANCTLERQKGKLADELSVNQCEVADLKRAVSQLMTASSVVDAELGSTKVTFWSLFPALRLRSVACLSPGYSFCDTACSHVVVTVSPLYAEGESARAGWPGRFRHTRSLVMYTLCASQPVTLLTRSIVLQ